MNRWKKRNLGDSFSLSHPYVAEMFLNWNEPLVDTGLSLFQV